MSFCNDSTFDVDEVVKLANEVFKYNEGFVADPKTEESSAEKQSDLLNKIKECRITLDSDIEKLSEDAVLTRLRTRRLIVANNKLSEKTAAIMAENTKLEQENAVMKANYEATVQNINKLLEEKAHNNLACLDEVMKELLNVQEKNFDVLEDEPSEWEDLEDL